MKKLTQKDLPLLVLAMDRKKAANGITTLVSSANDKVQGEMSIDNPLEIAVQGSMSQEEYKSCSLIMTVCQNMVQKVITDAAKARNIPPADALKQMNVWIQGFVDFPFPFFNFKDTQSQTISKNDFSLSLDASLVESIVNISNVKGLVDAVIGALKKSGGKLVDYKNQNKKFNYFGIITGYNVTEVSTRVIKFQLDLKSTDIAALCGSFAKTKLDSAYDTYQFVGDKNLLIETHKKIGDGPSDYFAKKLMVFMEEFYENQLKKYKDGLGDQIR